MKKRIVGAIAAVVVMLIGAGLAFVWSATALSCVDVEFCDHQNITDESQSLQEAIHFFDADDVQFASTNGARRMSRPIESLPVFLTEGFVAVEDKRFWEHDGLDTKGMFRAMVQNVTSGGVSEGASTIAMQLVRTLHSDELAQTGRWRKKLIELRSAPRIVDELGHEGVLQLYLNAIYLGEGTWGVGAASENYFGVPPDSMTIPQAATLIGMTRTPERYNPKKYPDRATTRRNDVLDVMEREGVITGAQAAEAKATPMETLEYDGVDRRRSYITSAAHRELEDVAPRIANMSGLRIYTTIDPDMQEAAAEAIAHQLSEIERGVYGRFLGDPAPDELEAADQSPYLQGAAVAMNAHDGAIRALVGGRDFIHSEVDRVSNSRRQVGSLVKPFIWAEALRRGHNMYDEVSTDPVEWKLDRRTIWSPDDHVGPGSMSLRNALVNSSNRAAVRLGREVGVDRVLSTAERLGIEGPLENNPAALIGAFESSLMDVTTSYAAFANGGDVIHPYMIRRVEDANGMVLYSHDQAAALPTRALDAATAFLVVDAMKDVVNRGTGTRVRQAGYRGVAAGKTGTTNDGKDTWFVGVTPELAAGVWIGFDHPKPITSNAAGGTLAAPVWGRWMTNALGAGGTGSDWSPPVGLQKVRIDMGTGMILRDECPATGKVVTEWAKSTTYRPMNCPIRYDTTMDPYGMDRYDTDPSDSLYTTPTIKWGDTTRNERPTDRRPERPRPEPRTDTVARPAPADTAMRLPDLPPIRLDTVRPVTRPDTTPPPPPVRDTIPPPPDTAGTGNGMGR